MPDRVPLEYIGESDEPFTFSPEGCRCLYVIKPREERVYHFPPQRADALLQDRPDLWAEWTGKPRRAVNVEPDDDMG
jgi:hypothetical protein